MKSITTNAESSQRTATLTIDQADGTINDSTKPAGEQVAGYLQQAIAHHRQGQLQEAERLYRDVLRIQPDHPDANHNLGVLAVQVKQPAAGLPHFKIALESVPNRGQYWLSYIDALIRAGQADAAKQVLAQGRQRGLQGEAVEALAGRIEGLSGSEPSPQEINRLVALFAEGKYAEAAMLAQALTELFPLHGVGWKALGAVLKQMGRSEDALLPMQKAVVLLPEDAEAHNNLGGTFRDMRRLKEAEASYRRALEIKPVFAEAYYNLGTVLGDLGQLDSAVASFHRALEIRPDYAEVYSNLGITLQDMGRLDEAEASYRQALAIKPSLAEVHYNLGNILQNLGRLDEAEASYRQALAIKPDLAEAYSNLGNTLRELDRLDEAEVSYHQSLEIKPDSANVYSNLGVLLKGQGRLVEAETSYRRALAIKPDLAEAHYNLGNTLQNLGCLSDAEVCYRQALAIKPDFVEAYSNLGNAQQELGRVGDAEDNYRHALKIKPDFTDALNSLALLLNAQGKSIAALSTIKQSLQVKETGEAKSIFISCIKRLRFTHDDSEIRTAMTRALTEPWGRPGDLARLGIELVKLDQDIGGCLARAVKAWPLRLSAQDLLGENGFITLATDPLLCALLDSAPICDIEMEHFLTMVRRIMLEAAMVTSDGEASTVLNFYSLLARQCFTNEYVFSHTDDEIQKVSDLRDSLVAAMEAKIQVPALWLTAVAAYFPLYTFPFAPQLLERQWPDGIKAMLAQQVSEPEKELQLRSTIPLLTSIDDEVSLLVQNQYEENPYPRWIKAAPAGKVMNIIGYLCQEFPLASFKRHAKSGSIDILIAGCGTGQHSIQTAQQFQGGRVLAVDLSISSLSYAKRKTLEMGLTSIEYAQADLLKLGSLGRGFDVIESVGVLHHLGDPWAGWRVLLSLLRPGGFMRLGFYSEVARRDIIRIRTFIAEQGYGTTANEIRRCRQNLVGLDKSTDFDTTLNSPDFFSTSTCRDLLFHVQEHRMTLTGIDKFLRDNKLAFLGFNIDKHVSHAYRQRFPDDCAATNLAQWQIFEQENPDTFGGMYQFWIQKAG